MDASSQAGRSDWAGLVDRLLAGQDRCSGRVDPDPQTHTPVPIGLHALGDPLQHEVVSLVGARYSRGGGEGDYARQAKHAGIDNLNGPENRLGTHPAP